MNNFYIYIYLDNRKPGDWFYNNLHFKFQPFYIGKGRKYRINHHLQPSQLKKSSIKSNIILTIQKEMKVNPIHYKIYENLSYEESNIIETDLIKYFGRRDLKTGILANMTDGGEGFKNIVISDETKEKMSIKAKGTKTYNNNGQSKIVQKSSKNGKIIKIYSSLREAAEDNNIHFSNISNWCRKICKSTDGYDWEYLGKSYKKEIKSESPPKRKKVYQYDLDGNFIQEWESMSKAAEITGINHISGVCLGRLNFAGGFQWRYEFIKKLPKLTYEITKNINRIKNIN